MALTAMPGLIAGRSPVASLSHPAPLVTTGKIIYVSSSAVSGGDDNPGDNPIRPKRTTTGALVSCVANRGDKIVYLPGHAETIRLSQGINVNKAGVDMISLGTGASRATFTFESDTAASILFSAASCRMINCIGVPGIADLTQPFDITADDCALDIEWQDASATVDARRAVLATDVNRLAIKLKYLGYTNAASVLNAIQLNGCSHVDVDIDAYGNAASAWVEFASSQCYNVHVKGRLNSYGITDGTHNVIDTVGGSEWSADIFDVGAGARYIGGSGRDLYEAWRGTDSMLTVLRALGVVDLSDELAELTDKFDTFEDAFEQLLEE